MLHINIKKLIKIIRMKKILFSIAFLVALITTGCYKTINTMHSGTSLVLSYPARVDYNTVSSGINYWNKALLSFLFALVFNLAILIMLKC